MTALCWGALLALAVRWVYSHRRLYLPVRAIVAAISANERAVRAFQLSFVLRTMLTIEGLNVEKKLRKYSEGNVAS